MKVLLKELQEDPRTLSSTNAEKSEQLQKELAIFQTARYLKDKLGDEVIKQHIISHTESVSDMFELAIMLKEVGLLDNQKARVKLYHSLKQSRTLKIHVLFMEEYLDYWYIVRSLGFSKQRLPRIMLGYSDSNKRWLLIICLDTL